MSHCKKPFLIAQSRKSKGKSIKVGHAKDLKFGAYALDKILNIRAEFRQDHEELNLKTVDPSKLFKRFTDMATGWFSTGVRKKMYGV